MDHSKTVLLNLLFFNAVILYCTVTKSSSYQGVEGLGLHPSSCGRISAHIICLWKRTP